ncbi:MAG TPA: alpha/beta fold hydrolase [Saprospiraceae bacterium]|mgnify:FL=1|nr:alpha/beta fold hydrolase [Saprospiraceae bacterium]
MQPQLLHISATLPLERGGQLSNATLAYYTYGLPGNPVVWVCHPFHTSANAADWWPGLFGQHGYFNPDKYFIVCVNVPGSCFGSTGPLSENPAQGGSAYFHEFPLLTIRDLALANETLRRHLKIQKIHLLIGPATGGQVALEWAIEAPGAFAQLVLISTNARQSPWAIAINESRRMAIEADITWRKNHPQAGEAGLRAAEALALLYAGSSQAYGVLQDAPDAIPDAFRAAAFQQEQSLQRVRDFNAFSSYLLSKAADTHDVGRNRGGIAAALAEVQAKTMVIGISSDQLFPCAEQRFLAEKIPGAIYREVHSDAGHEGYLTESSRLTHLLKIFLEAESDSLSAEATSHRRHPADPG